MKFKVRQQDKEKTLTLLSDHQSHTNKEIEAATGNWFADDIIRALRHDGYSIRRIKIGRGVVCYRMTAEPVVEEKRLFD